MLASIREFRLGWWLLPVALHCYCISFVPAQVIRPLDLQVFAGENAVFECVTLHPPSLYWNWYMDTHDIVYYSTLLLDGYELTVNDRNSTLTILNTTMEDNRTHYYCESEGYGDISQRATLTIIQRTWLDSTYPQCEINVTEVNTKNTVTLICSARGGDPRPALQWYTNGTAMQQREFVNIDDASYYVGHQHSVVPEDEGDVFICKAEGVAVKESQSCFVRLNISPTVIVSADSTVFYDGDSVTCICATETPWTIAGYQWSVNSQIVTSSGLQSHVEDNGRVLSLSDLNQNHARIEVGCNVTTASGLVGNDVIKLEYIDKTCRSNDSNVTLVVCLSLAIVSAFLFGLFISRIVKCNNCTQLKEPFCAGFQGSAHSDQQMARNTTNYNVNKGMNPTGDDEPVYQNSPFKMSFGKTAPPIEGITEDTSYSSLNPTACSTYAELNPATID